MLTLATQRSAVVFAIGLLFLIHPPLLLVPRKLWFAFFLSALVALPLAALYLYRRENVVAYFAGKPRTRHW